MQYTLGRWKFRAYRQSKLVESMNVEYKGSVYSQTAGMRCFNLNQARLKEMDFQSSIKRDTQCSAWLFQDECKTKMKEMRSESQISCPLQRCSFVAVCLVVLNCLFPLVVVTDSRPSLNPVSTISLSKHHFSIFLLFFFKSFFHYLKLILSQDLHYFFDII